ncbi:MAG: tRNA dihydrouridine synthase DusB [Rhabdochlamydiaceae bacterium]|nr:tRNA dihydrouridine synthase DusB [Rhabdochlamydiaceae bacterium]
MKFLKKPFFLGSKELPSNIFCAPLAGCSDVPFRRMTSRYNPGLIYTEMVKMDALVRNDPHTFRMLDYELGMHPIGGQLCGSKPELAGACAKIIEDLGFDVVDLNCGCPVDKVTKDGSGSAMLKNPEKIGEILANMVAAVKIPVTVKIRAGWDSNSICSAEITRIAEQAGASAICIHGRTRAQAYKGPANWDYIAQAKQAAKKIQVIANGDIFDPHSAQGIFEASGCDAILLARGTMGQPWLIEDIYRFFEDGVVVKRTSLDYKKALLEHIAHIVSYQTDRKSLLDIRRVGCYYLKGGRGTKHLREAINRSASLEETYMHIQNFSWEEADFSPQTQSEVSEEVTC